MADNELTFYPEVKKQTPDHWREPLFIRVLWQERQESHEESKALQPSSRFEHRVNFDGMPAIWSKEGGATYWELSFVRLLG